jgi:hypothetical protein
MLKIGFNFLIEFFRGIVKEIIADVTEKASLWVDKEVSEKQDSSLFNNIFSTILNLSSPQIRNSLLLRQPNLQLFRSIRIITEKIFNSHSEPWFTTFSEISKIKLDKLIFYVLNDRLLGHLKRESIFPGEHSDVTSYR